MSKELELLSVKLDDDGTPIVQFYKHKKNVVYALADATLDGLSGGNSDIFDILANTIYYVLASNPNGELKKAFLENLEESVPKIREAVMRIGKLVVSNTDALAEMLMNNIQEQ